MEKIIRLNNPNFKGINFLYYKGISKLDILKSKSDTIKKIPRENILGLGYNIQFIQTNGGKSSDDITYAENICEYAIVKVDKEAKLDLKTREFYKDKLLLCIPLSSLIFGSEYKVESERYKLKLNKLGYIELPLNFTCLENNDLIELFENNKFKSLEEETPEKVSTVKVSKIHSL